MGQVPEFLLTILNCVPKSKLLKVNSELESVAKELTDYKAKMSEVDEKMTRYEQKIASLKKLSYELRMQLGEYDLLSWCYSSTISEVDMLPLPLRVNVKKLAKKLLNNSDDDIKELFWPKKVKSKEIYTLYWSLAYAAKSASNEVKNLSNEDAITTTLIQSLKKHIDELANQNRSDLAYIEIGVSNIFSRIRPAIKESMVGADLLIMFSGRGLLRSGGVKLLWIQAKLEKNAQNEKCYLLNYWRPLNAAGTYQCDLLRNVHNPQKGSCAIYVQYSYMPCVLTASIEKLSYPAPSTPADSVVRLNFEGNRFQETITNLVVDNNIGEFDSAAAVIDFLNQITNKSVVPLNIITAYSKYDYEAKETLKDIYRHYISMLEEKLDINLQSEQVCYHERPGAQNGFGV